MDAPAGARPAALVRGAPFALLDDCSADAAREGARRSRLYSSYAHQRVCVDPVDLEAQLALVDDDLHAGLHAVVLADFEWGARLERARHNEPAEAAGLLPAAVLKRAAGQSADALGGLPDAVAGGGATPNTAGSLRILLFRELAFLSASETAAWLAAQDDDRAEPSVAGVANLTPSVTRDEFDYAIERVHDALCDGESYQINYTYRLHFDVFGAPLALYRRLRARQPVAFAALIALPDARWVVSLSPELFVEHHRGRIAARPMKGTAARSPDPLVDAQRAAELGADPKNRAENVMIVDLLRNDLGRIARTGSVSVPTLFALEPYASVWQMTSTVEAQLREGTGFADVLRALFPCGSITGAPKHRTIELIEAIETTPRGLYTGAIGWLEQAGAAARSCASAQACGDFCLSVAIRTLTLDPSARGATHRGRMGVGAGIVLDSVAASEYDECALKARFLTGADPGFALFETMFATRAGVRHRDRHLARIGASASVFGFPFDGAALRARLSAQCASFDADVPHRLRLALHKNGDADLTCAPLAPLAGDGVVVLVGDEHGFPMTDADDLFLAHKTTVRETYDRAWRYAETRGAFDTVFFNRRGELTEGARSNVFVKLDGQWVTPPLSSGALPGVMRAVLLADPAYGALERTITRQDFERAEAVMICNALRGAVPAQVIRGG
jgi:para-aminobenzoate synthetase/4-amino-4-deoxychorismate lyase